MRYGSAEGLTLLALIATDGRCDYDGLLAEARDIVARPDRRMAGHRSTYAALA